jgi:hypothetical protein
MQLHIVDTHGQARGYLHYNLVFSILSYSVHHAILPILHVR